MKKLSVCIGIIVLVAAVRAETNKPSSTEEVEARRIANEVLRGVKKPQFSPVLQAVYDYFVRKGCEIEQSSQSTGSSIEEKGSAETLSLVGNVKGAHFDVLIARAQDVRSLQRVQEELSKQGALSLTNGLLLLTFNDDSDEATMTSSAKQQIADIFKSFQSR